MDVEAELEAPCSVERLFVEVDDLVRYPSWLSIVPRAVAAEDGESWVVDLRGRLGPMARSKRLRMVRTAHEAPSHCRFEREEQDGRNHSRWVLDATVEPAGTGTSKLIMRLHYGGTFGGSLLERMLRDEIERSRPALLERVAGAEAAG
ncbi:MAG: SRPBCC family protein [Actinobacteria bacterium]|nr:SRPBCC family protein [Actinomycetota bacterium]